MIIPLRFIAVLLLLLTIFCAERVDQSNPFDPDYGGDYRFGIEVNPRFDTAAIFRQYEIICIDSGIDKFESFSLATDPPGKIKPVYRHTSPLPLYFTAPFSGRLIVTGFRPNETKIDHAVSVVVVNPFRIEVDSGSIFSGDAVRFKVVDNSAPGIVDHSLAVRWMRKGRPPATAIEQPVDSAFYLSVLRPDSFEISATIIDRYGNLFDLNSVTVAAPAIARPSVSVTERVLRASAGRPCTIVTSMTNADSLSWRVNGLGIDTVTTTPSITLAWPDTCDDTVIVIAKNRFGTYGDSDTVYIQVRSTAIDLELIRFPTSVRARTPAVWEVSAKRSGKAIPDSEATYRWTVTPQTAPDSLRAEGGRLMLYFSDNPGVPVSVRVDAICGPDTSWPRTAEVTVIADKPLLEIIRADTSITLGDTALIVVRTRDSNDSGFIIGTFYRLTGDTASAMKSDTLRFIGTSAGVQRIEFWCVDNDVFSSPVKSVNVLVTSNRPYFLRSFADTTVYAGDNVRITAIARAGNTGGTITQWFWDFGADGSVERVTSVDYLDTNFTETGAVFLRAGCRDDRGDSAETLMVFTINVSLGTPSVILVAPVVKTAYHGDTVRVRIVASDPNGTVDTLLFGRDTADVRRIVRSLPAKSIDTAVLYVVNQPGIYRFCAAAIDNAGLRSPWMVAYDSVHVASSAPMVTKLFPGSVWIFDSVAYTVSASDPDGNVMQYRIQWEPEAAWLSSSDSTMIYRYTTHGTKSVRVVVFDNRGNTSDTLNSEIIVKLGRPAVSVGLFPDSVWVHEAAAFSLGGSDENGKITAWAVQWESGGQFEMRTSDGSFTHTFTDTGVKNVRAFVRDDDGIISDTVQHSVHVRLGKPAITSVTSSPGAGAIFVGSAVTFTVNGKAATGQIDSLFVWTKDTVSAAVYKVAASNNCASFSHTFAVADSGVRMLRIRLADSRGIIADTLLAVTVRSGAPAVRSARCEKDTIWVNREYKFHVKAYDTNGVISKLYVNWEGGTTHQAEITVPGGGRQSIDTFFVHKYDTTGGPKTARFWVRDNHNILSSMRDTAFTVRRGVPVVWGDSGDTLFLIVDRGYGDYYYKPKYADTNGVIDTFYFGQQENIALASKGKVDSAVFNIDETRVNKGATRYIWVKDDDGLIGGGRFVVFADSAPPRPTDFNGMQPVSDSVVLKWNKVQDYKDGMQTKVQILYCYNSGCTPTDSLFPSNALPTLTEIESRWGTGTIGGTPASVVKFKKPEGQPTGVGRWRVILVDERGTASQCTEGCPATFEVP